MSCFSVVPIGPEETDQAYALIRMFAPEVPPDLWSDFVASRTPGELLGLQTPDGSIFGLASYRIEDLGSGGRRMIVDNFWTAELSRAAPGRALLARTLERSALLQGCRDVRQITRCDGGPQKERSALRNHLLLTDPVAGRQFSKCTGCTCGDLRARSAAEMYPVR